MKSDSKCGSARGCGEGPGVLRLRRRRRRPPGRRRADGFMRCAARGWKTQCAPQNNIANTTPRPQQ